MRSVKQFLLKKATPCLCAAILLVSPLSLCVRAAVWEGSANVGYTYWGSTDGVAYFIGQDTLLPVSGLVLEEAKSQRTSNGMRLDLGELSWSSPVSIYISSYYRNSHSSATITEVGDPWDISNYEISYTLPTNTKQTVQPEYIAVFTPNDDASMAYVGDGMSLVAKVEASEGRPVSNVKIKPIEECGWKRTGANSLYGQWFWTSVRVISAETSAELDALDSVASEIIAGNQILEAMRGDIVELLSMIYATVGDIEIAANATRTMVSTLLTYVDGLEGQLESIYTTLG